MEGWAPGLAPLPPQKDGTHMAHTMGVFLMLAVKKQTPTSQWGVGILVGDPGRIRTGDLQIRSQLLYPAELRGQTLPLYP